MHADWPDPENRYGRHYSSYGGWQCNVLQGDGQKKVKK